MIRMLATVVLTFWWGVCILTRPKETKTWEEFTWCISLPPEGYFSFLFLSLSLFFKQLSVFPSATPIPFSSSCSTVSFSDFYFTFDSVLFFLEKKIKASRNWACLCLGHCFVSICKERLRHSFFLLGFGQGWGWEGRVGAEVSVSFLSKKSCNCFVATLGHEVLSIFRWLIQNLGIV